MRLAEDDRGRVPFAVVAVLLLVGSATYAAHLGTRDPGGADPDVPRAMDRANAAARTAVADAVATAARRAARAPVVDPADTPWGRALDDDDPFRDYLRLRIYLAARRALNGTDQRVDGVRAGASLPPVESADDVAAATERVDLTAENGTLRVAIRNVTVTARRSGEVLARERRGISVGVRSPVLAVHEAVERYEQRLNAGPLEPGMGRQLTARLYGLAWARGYAYYGGAPIENVVSNRHVEVLTNGAALSTQRSVFGATDPAGRDALAQAWLEIAARDVIAPVFGGGGLTRRAAMQSLLKTVLPKRSDPWSPVPGLSGPIDPRQGPEDEVTVGVNRTAGRAFAAFTGSWNVSTVPGDGPTLGSVINRTYAADVQVLPEVEPVSEGSPPPLDPPGPDWEYAGEVRSGSALSVAGETHAWPVEVDGWDPHWTVGRRVVRTNYTVRRWRDGNRTTTTNATWHDRFDVALTVMANHAPAAVPDNPIAVLHRRGGPLNGRNLAGVPDRAVRRLVENRGGADALARRAVAGGTRAVLQRVRIGGERPPDLREWIYRDLVGLRERVRNVSVEVPRRSALFGRSGARALLERVRDRRYDLIDAPDTYRSVADKVRVAARRAYLQRVLDTLESRADQVERTRSGINATLDGQGVGTLQRVDRILTSRRSASRAAGRLPDGRGGDLTVRVDGAPSYLTLATVGHDRVPAVPRGLSYRALTARNINVFTYPYANVADAVVEAVLGSPDRVSLRTAATALRQANRTLDAVNNRTVANRRDALQSAVVDSVATARNYTARMLAFETNLSHAEARAAVAEGLARWGTVHGRALAVANGSAADPVADAALGRVAVSGPARDDVRAVARTGLSVARSLGGVRPPQGVVNRSSTATQKTARRATREFVTAGMDNLTDRLQDRWFGNATSAVPVGMPVTPAPGSWYATVNFWHVEVAGEYARFTVRTARNGRFAGVTGIQYARDGGAVSLDVDGDGAGETLGHATRLSFDVETTVAVVVPPGGTRGVGDTNGKTIEESAGWPRPGVVGDGSDPVFGPANRSAPGRTGATRPRVGGPPDRPVVPSRQPQTVGPAVPGYVPRGPAVGARDGR